MPGEDVRPLVGDLTICTHCGTALQFGLGLVLQPVPDHLKDHPDLMILRAVVNRVRKKTQH